MKLLLKSLLFLILLQAFNFKGICQTKYEPTILILSPNKVNADKSSEKEISSLNSDLIAKLKDVDTTKIFGSDEFMHQPENLRLMYKSQIEFQYNPSFVKSISLISCNYLAYKFFEKFPNLLFKLKDEKLDSDLLSLRTLAKSNELQYVLNFPTVSFYKDKGVVYSKIAVQLYDLESNSFVLDSLYIGDWHNPGFEFSCQDKSLACTINNALSKALVDITNIISNNSPTLTKERELTFERFDVLSNDYFKRLYNIKKLTSIISSKDSSIDTKNAYQILFNNDSTKFISFFIEQVPKQGFETFKANKKDRNVNILTNKDIKDKGFFDEVPNTYAFIVKGENYEGRWYYEKSNVTYFTVDNLSQGKLIYFNNLQSWNFFKDGTTDFNPDFWQTSQFEKVEDLKKDPNWDKYHDMWEDEEANNRDYIGLTKIVANQLSSIEETKNDSLSKELKVNQFLPYYSHLKKVSADQCNDIYDHSIILPKSREFAINPALFTNKKGEMTIHYFVYVSKIDRIFEWTYFEPLSVKNRSDFGPTVVDQISKLTSWNFSHMFLDDPNFWDSYVFTKVNGQYKYLK